MPRLVGLLTMGLGILVVQVIRLGLAAIYPTIIGVRVFFVATYVGLYAMCGDPFFITLSVMVGLGVVLSALAFIKDRAG
jgi:hypothetical protein